MIGIKMKNDSKAQNRKYGCLCCGNMTLETRYEYDICPVCFWEDDEVQGEDPDFSGGANDPSLNEARKNYNEFGACERRFLKQVREPKEAEKPNE